MMLLALLTTLFIATNLSFGYTFSTLAQNQLQAMQMAMMFFLPNLLLSGFLFPFAGMPGWAQWIGEALPLTHFIRIVRAIMLKGSSIADLNYDALALFCLMLFAMGDRGDAVQKNAGLEWPSGRIGNDRPIDPCTVICAAQVGGDLRITELARDAGEGSELLAMRRGREQEQEHDVDRLAVDRGEIDCTPEPRQHAEGLRQAGDAGVRNGDSVPHAGRAEPFALNDRVGQRRGVEVKLFRSSPRQLSEQPIPVGRAHVAQRVVGREEVGNLHCHSCLLRTSARVSGCQSGARSR